MTSGGPKAGNSGGSPAARPASRLVNLAHCDLFRDLAADRIADLERRCRCVRFAAGDTILAAEDNRAHNVFVVLQGTGEVLRRGPFGDFVLLATLHPGMYFGEFAAIDGRSGSATVRASSEAILAEIPREVFRLLLRDEPTVAWRMMERLIHVIRSLDSRVSGLQGCQEEVDRIHRELFLVNL
jgi:CRP/FNR family transcriptional regulator, cyclic AMP receptor protein